MSSVANHHAAILGDVQPSKARKPRRKPARFVRLRLLPHGTSPGVLRIAVGHESTDYLLFALSCDFGRAFRLEKIGVEGEDDHYHVNLDDKPTCDCKGHTHHGHCKHADGLAALIAAGRL